MVSYYLKKYYSVGVFERKLVNLWEFGSHDDQYHVTIPIYIYIETFYITDIVYVLRYIIV